MAKGTLAERIKAVLLYTELNKERKDICALYGISTSTFWRWVRAHRANGPKGLEPKRPGPHSGRNSLPKGLKRRILHLKQKHPSWGARRIKYQYGLPCHWMTVHRVIKTHGLLVRIKPKPQPCKRFQRRHVDSLWQGDTFQFRIKGVGKVYLTGLIEGYHKALWRELITQIRFSSLPHFKSLTRGTIAGGNSRV